MWADIFRSHQPDIDKAMDTELVYHMVCVFTPQLSLVLCLP